MGFMNSVDNIILLTDSYKVSHYKQYPPQTEVVYSYFESRGGEFPETVFFGLQYFLKRYLAGQVVSTDRINEAAELLQSHFSSGSFFNREGWQHLCDQHGGRLPVRIKAVPEGSVVPTSNVLMTIENTDPACFWLTNYLETLLVQVWYPSTVATLSRSMKQVIAAGLKQSGAIEELPYKLHDFGFRGVSSVESAGLGGAGHLLNFRGTDNLAGILLAKQYYGADMPGVSIPAAEHSTLTSWGRQHEVDAYRNMLEQFPEGLVAVVSDSYDLMAACRDIWGGKLKELVMQRNGTLVIRPDSGDPPTILLQVLSILGDAFGTTVNEKGYRVLDSHVRLIQGDGIDREMLARILSSLLDNGWSAENLAYGSGGGLLQKLNRDTCKYAFKCSAAKVAGVYRDVYKQPVTDQGKRSKAGRLKLVNRSGKLLTVREETASGETDELVEVFCDGELLRDWSWNEIVGRTEVG